MPKPLTTPQAALLARLPAEFIREEDYRNSNFPGTVIRGLDGREQFRFTKGDARAFNSLWQASAILDVEKRHEGLLFRTVFMKA